MEEVVVQETRDQQMDLLARAKFAQPEVPFNESRVVIEEALYPYEGSSSVLDDMLLQDWMELG